MSALTPSHSSFTRHTTSLTSRFRDWEDRVVRLGGDVLRESIKDRIVKDKETGLEEVGEERQHQEEGGGREGVNCKPSVGAMNSILPTLISLHQSQSHGVASEFSLVPCRGPSNLGDIPVFLNHLVNVGTPYPDEGGGEEEEGKGDGEGEGEKGEDGDGIDEYERIASYEIKAREVREDFKNKRPRFT